MTNVFKGFDLLFTIAATVAFGFAGYVFGSMLLSREAGSVLGVAIFLSSLAMTLTSYLQEQRLKRLVDGLCPRCGAAVAVEHLHRRWRAEERQWLRPATSWQCARCGFNHAETWACPACPADD